MKTATIRLTASPTGAMRFEVVYRGRVQHEEPYGGGDSADYINALNGRRAARAAEVWAGRNGYDRVQWDGTGRW